MGSWTLADVKTLTDILQNLTLTVATIVAAWWAYVTLTFKEKTEELSTIARKIIEIHSYIDTTATTYKLRKDIDSLTGSHDEQSLNNFKYEAEDRLEVLKTELSDLQSLSLRVSIAFRFLDITEYQSELIMLGGIEKWDEKIVRDKLLKAKVEIIHKINDEVNAHGKFFRAINIKLQNMIYRIKHLKQ